MDIEIGSRAYKVFLWALGICETFNHKGDYTWRFQDGTNLCHYCRVVFFYVPLIFVAQILTWLIVACAVFFLPIYLWGYMGYIGWGKIAGIIVSGIIVSIVLLLIGGFWLGGYIKTWNYERRQRKMYSKSGKSGHPSQVEIIKEWILAKKSNICPKIRFIYGKEDVQ